MNDLHAHTAHQNTPDPSLLTESQMQARIAELEAENAALKAGVSRADSMDEDESARLQSMIESAECLYSYSLDENMPGIERIAERDIHAFVNSLLRDKDIEIQRLSREIDVHDASLFQRVMTASSVYVTRFQGEITFEGALKKMREEFDEYIEAAADTYQYQHARIPPLHLYEDSPETVSRLAARELIDLLVTIGGLASAIDLTWPAIEQAAIDTLTKLDNRTPETHEWRTATKTVERKGR